MQAAPDDIAAIEARTDDISIMNPVVSRSSGSTQIVMLGTGTPRPDPDRSGPATAIAVNGASYLVDFGPGVIRRATAAFEGGVTGLGFGGIGIRTAFLTHLHSDHTMGYPDLIFTPWIMGRPEPLTVYGPKGITDMTRHILDAWKVDIDARTTGINRHNANGCKVDAREIAPGVVYEDHNVMVTAFPVRHEEMVDSFGFRFDTLDRSIVISGDTCPTQALIDRSRGCDVLIHEAYTLASYRGVSARAQEFRRCHHTSSAELAGIANAVKPRLLVIYHRSNVGGGPVGSDSDDVLLDEVRQTYRGEVVAARDLDVF
jgi:ribonuclease BN (tRNA processing enzyme)